MTKKQLQKIIKKELYKQADKLVIGIINDLDPMKIKAKPLLRQLCIELSCDWELPPELSKYNL